jgi:DNA-binding GntR family transcriptional regulator
VLPKRGLLVSPLDLVGQLNLLELRREVEGLICRLAAGVHLISVQKVTVRACPRSEH